MDNLKQVQGQLEELQLIRLRGISTNYIMELLSAVSLLILGTAEGQPELYGETSQEERKGIREWMDCKKNVIKVKKGWSLPFHDIKLYGGQQFERLLGEFKMVTFPGQETLSLQVRLTLSLNLRLLSTQVLSPSMQTNWQIQPRTVPPASNLHGQLLI